MSLYDDIEKTYDEINKETLMYKNGIIRFCKSNKEIEKLVNLVIHNTDFDFGTKEYFMSITLRQLIMSVNDFCDFYYDIFYNLYEFILEYINITDDKYNYEDDGDFFLPYKCVLKIENNLPCMDIYDVNDIDNNKVPENATSSAKDYFDFIENRANEIMKKHS